MANRKQRRRSRALQKLILVLVIIVIVILIGYFLVFLPMKEKATSVIAEKLIESQMPPDEQQADAGEILDSMTEEDQEIIQEIVDSHISAEAISDVTSYITSGDTAGLKEYAKSSLSEEELEQLKDIYSKYKGEISEYLNQ